jgi:hypothetical protein
MKVALQKSCLRENIGKTAQMRDITTTQYTLGHNNHVIATFHSGAMIVHGQEGSFNVDGPYHHQKWPVFASFVSRNICSDNFGIIDNLTM